MSASVPVPHAASRAVVGPPSRVLTLTPAVARALLVSIVLAASVVGFSVTGAAAVAYWRLGSPVTWTRFAFYAVAVASMAAGPGLIWDMAQVKLGALFLHGGLLATVLLLWRDPAMSTRLSSVIAARRAKLT